MAVLVKAAIDVNLMKADSGGNVLTQQTPLVIAEYDRNAVQAAVDIKGKLGGTVAALSLASWGPVSVKKKDYENVMREVLAMGADEAHVVLDDEYIDGTPVVTAEVLATLAEKLGGFDIYVTGEGSSDMVSSQLASRLGALLDLPTVTFAKRIDIGDGGFKITRDLEDRLEIVHVDPPLVMSVTGEANQPRLPTLLQIRRAFVKPIRFYTAQDIGVKREARIEQLAIKVLAQKRKNVIIDGSKPEEAAEILIRRLIEDGVIAPGR